MQLITLNNQMEIPSHPTTPPMKFPAPKKLDARKKSRTYSSGKNRDVFRSPRSTQFDENTEHMLTLRRCSRVPIIEPDNFSRDLYLVFDDMDDNNQFENKVAIGNELHLHRSIQLPMRKSESMPWTIPLHLFRVFGAFIVSYCHGIQVFWMLSWSIECHARGILISVNLSLSQHFVSQSFLFHSFPHTWHS